MTTPANPGPQYEYSPEPPAVSDPVAPQPPAAPFSYPNSVAPTPETSIPTYGSPADVAPVPAAPTTPETASQPYGIPAPATQIPESPTSAFPDPLNSGWATDYSQKTYPEANAFPTPAESVASFDLTPPAPAAPAAAPLPDPTAPQYGAPAYPTAPQYAPGYQPTGAGQYQTGYPQQPYSAVQQPATPAPQPYPQTPTYAPISPMYVPPPSGFVQEKPPTVGNAALILALATVAISIVMGVVTGIDVGNNPYDNLSNEAAGPLGLLVILASLTGLAGFITGIVSTAGNMGRPKGIAAIIISVLAGSLWIIVGVIVVMIVRT
jgi:hypothetical protein